MGRKKMPIRVTCKGCGQKGTNEDFFNGCPNPECQLVARRRNRPPAIVGPTRHHPQCCCDRCLDEDASKVERRLDHQRAAYEAKQVIENAKNGTIKVHVRESEVVGPFEGDDMSKALYVMAPVAICGTIIPKGKRRK